MWTIAEDVPLVLSVVAFLAVATPARAERVYFPTGRSLSIASHRLEQGSLVLVLRSGGEITCEPSAVLRIVPDEVTPDPPPAAIATPAGNAVPYGAFIQQAAEANKVPVALLRAVIQVESDYQERAVSPRGAMGLMQLMPDTARAYAVADPYDPRANIEAGTRHLRSLLDRFSVPLALAAYNAGEGAVDRFGGIPPYPETQSYVSRVLALARISTR
jgi:Transglycosylase SLT domain